MGTRYKGIDRPGHCACCGKKLNPNACIMLELDQRINEYHSQGGVPESQSQGWFEFGSTCATKANLRAMELLKRLQSA
jgi:hypothetical protein